MPIAAEAYAAASRDVAQAIADVYAGRIPLPAGARALPVLGQGAVLTIGVTDRTAVQAP